MVGFHVNQAVKRPRGVQPGLRIKSHSGLKPEAQKEFSGEGLFEGQFAIYPQQDTFDLFFRATSA
jgi:hypothetical protein